MNNKSILVGFLIVAVAIAGCVHTNILGDDGNEDEQEDFSSSITQNDGLTITLKSPTNSYEDGQNAVLEAEFENTGEGDAKVATGDVSIFGPSWASEDGDVPTSEENLEGYDQLRGIQGESWNTEFNPTINANLAEGQEEPYTVFMTTTYEYDSETRSTLTLVGEDEWENRAGAQTTMTDNILAGPVQIQFNGETPFPADRDEVSVPVQATNVGDGDVVDEQVDVAVNLEGSSSTISLGDDCEQSGMDLFDGQREFRCTITIDEGLSVPERTFSLTATANYTYSEENQARFRAVGQ